MRPEEIRPFVRYIHLFEVEKASALGPMVCLDRRMMAVRRGRGGFEIGNAFYRAEEGDVFLWPAGTRYRTLGPMELWGVNFDLVEVPGAPLVPVAPVDPRHFDPSMMVENVLVEEAPALNGVLHLSRAEFAHRTLEAMLEEYNGKRLLYRQSLQGMMQSLLCRMIRRIPQGESGDLAERLLAYIQAHYGQNLTAEQLSDRFHFHPSTLNRAMRRHTGMSVHRYLLEYRISQAVNLLATTALCVEEVAGQVGFADANYFSRYFRKVMGASPRAFARQARDPGWPAGRV